MPWTADDREALKRAIGEGARVVSYGDRRVEYRSLDDMWDILDAMDEELGARKRARRILATPSNGIRS
jgi:hypothetical protein